MPCQSFTPVALLVPEMTEPQPASKGLDKPAAAGQSDPPVENLPDSGHMSGGKSSESRGSSPEDEFDEAPPPAGAEGGRGARREGLEREITKQVAEKVEADAKAEVAVSGGVSNSGSNAGSDSEPEDPDLASEDEGAGPPSILDRVEDALDPSCQDLAQITKAIDDAEADGCTHPAFKALLEKRDQLVEDKGESEEEEDALPSAKAKSKPGSALAPRISACVLTRLVLLQRCRRRNRQPTDATLWLPCRQGTRIFLASALSK